MYTNYKNSGLSCSDFPIFHITLRNFSETFQSEGKFHITSYENSCFSYFTPNMVVAGQKMVARGHRDYQLTDYQGFCENFPDHHPRGNKSLGQSW